VILLLFLAFLIVVGIWRTGLYSIQPIGAISQGVTLWVWRQGDEPFFNSPDATCLRRVGYVSLFCRAAAAASAPRDRIIARLPYISWAYLQSTGGKTFEH